MHRVETRPLFGDVDAMNVVYYGNYLRLFELGRAELMRAEGFSYQQMADSGLHLPVSETGVKYLSPIFYDDLVIIQSQVSWVKKASVQFEYHILRSNGRGEDLLATGFTKHACVDLNGRIKPLPGTAVEAMKRHLLAQ